MIKPDEFSAPFFAGTLRGELMLQRCKDCGTHMSPIAYIGVPLRARCVTCFGGDLEWAASSGRATLFSFAVVHRAFDEAFAAEVPYNIAVVQTAEGVRLTSQVVDCPIDELRIDMPLQVVFERVSDEVAVPRFRRLR